MTQQTDHDLDARLAFEPLVMQWEPIETAPLDGNVILGYDPTWYDIATPMVFDKRKKKFVFFHSGEEIRATHWMPMPNIPSA